MAHLSAFADEITPDFIGQLQFLQQHKVNAIELHTVNHKNVADLTELEQKQIRQNLIRRNMTISGIASNIGKIALDEPFGLHLDYFKRVIDMALLFNTPLVRVYSFYPPHGKKIQRYRKQIIQYFAFFLNYIGRLNITLLVENALYTFGQTAENCVDLIQSLKNPQLGLIYNPSNFIKQNIPNPAQSSWPVMKPFVKHIYLTDWKYDDPAVEPVGVLPGTGDARIPELLKELAGMNYSGYISLAPRLKSTDQSSGLSSGELFLQALNGFKNLAHQTQLILD